MKKYNIDKRLDDVLMGFRRSIIEEFNKGAKVSGLSGSHFEVMMNVADKGSMTMKEIALLLHITPPSASSLVDKLVEKKFLKRIESDHDRRTIEVSLGIAAQGFFRSIHKRKMFIFKKMISRLNQQDKENLINIITKCISNY